ncbi:MAG: nitrogen fixation sigma-54 dependent transcriptional regulator GnfM [Rhodothermales bacterium]
MPLRVFLVDDDPDYLALLRYQFTRRTEADLHLFHSGEAALKQVEALDPDLVLLDVVMPGIGGLETLRRLRTDYPDLPVVMVSAQSVVSVALEALELGAYDYITKGHDDTAKLQTLISQIAERVALSEQVASLREQLPGAHGLTNLVGESKAMRQVFTTVRKTLRGDLTVAILGESGTGKELIAEAIHYNSKRRHQPFVIVNCAAIPSELMESEFFGHEKGSFTGAYSRKLGKFEQAHNGTIFLDEIGELDLSLQAKLLRVLQNQQLQRVGGSETITVDVRVLCATNRDIMAMVREGTFREDLYYRLFQFPVQLPPLRERDQDPLLLADHFRKRFLERHTDLEARPFSTITRRALLKYRWPGNVRELKNAVERALLIADGAEIMPADLMLGNPFSTPHGSPTASEETADHEPAGPAHPERVISRTQTPDDIVRMEEVKRIALEHAYALCRGNIEQTAQRLGITRSTVYRLLKRHNIRD